MVVIEGFNSTDEGNPEATKWENMDVRGQAGGESPEGSLDVQGQAENTEPISPDDASREADQSFASFDENPENNEQDSAEQDSSTIDSEVNEQSDNREQSRAEKNLEDCKRRLDEIERELVDVSADKAELENALDGIDNLLEENFKQHESLSAKADQFELEVKQTKRSIISKLLRIPKAIIKAATNQNEEFFSLVENNPFDFTPEVQKGKEAQNSLKDTQKEIEANESENEELQGSREDTIDQIKSVNKKTARLNREKARLEKQAEELREIVYNEGFEEAIADTTDGAGVRGAIRMEKSNIRGYKGNIRKLEGEQRKIDKRFDESIKRADAKMQEVMKQYEDLINTSDEKQGAEWQERAERASEGIDDLRKLAEQSRMEELGEKDAQIAIEQEKIDTSLGNIEFIKGLRESEGIKGTLLRLKQKIINRMRGLA